MLLAVDVGNTQTVFGVFDGESLVPHLRGAPEGGRTAGPSLPAPGPPPTRAYEELVERYVEAPLLVIGPGVKTGIAILYDNPHEVGPDRIVNSVAARARYGTPALGGGLGP